MDMRLEAVGAGRPALVEDELPAAAADKIDHDAVQQALGRIRAAVAARTEPLDADLALAQRALGNARVSEILAGRDLPAAPGVAVRGAHKLVAYARHRFATGPFDLGHAFIGLESPGTDYLFGFHPTRGGLRALRPGGLPGVVRRDQEQVGAGVRMLEVAVTEEQLAKALEAAQAYAASPPEYDFYRWNCLDFVAAVAAAAGVTFPITRFGGVADPEGVADSIERDAEAKPAGGGGGGGAF